MAVFCIGIFSFTELQAGTVRTAYSDGVAMLPVNLRMGHSTILRFLEKPRKVVLGNSNYYSVEFIDNDLAIQPLGTVTTNFFVYGIKNVYGFILRTNQGGNYDDLVQLELKEHKSVSVAKVIARALRLKELSRPRLSFRIGSDLKVTLLRVQKFEVKDYYVLDLQLENMSKNVIDLSKLEIALSRGKLKLSPQEFILWEKEIKPTEITSARGFVSIDKKADVSLDVQFKNIKSRLIISGRFL